MLTRNRAKNTFQFVLLQIVFKEQPAAALIGARLQKNLQGFFDGLDTLQLRPIELHVAKRTLKGVRRPQTAARWMGIAVAGLATGVALLG
jgi:hypothetical protein